MLQWVLKEEEDDDDDDDDDVSCSESLNTPRF
jgi:hypothetical protein